MNIVGTLGWIAVYFVIGLFVGGVAMDEKTGKVNMAIMCFWPLYVVFVVGITIIALVIGLAVGIANAFRR